MKKLTIQFSMIAVNLLLVFTSCTKQDVLMSNPYNNQVQQVTDDFLVTATNIPKQDTPYLKSIPVITQFVDTPYLHNNQVMDTPYFSTPAVSSFADTPYLRRSQPVK